MKWFMVILLANGGEILGEFPTKSLCQQAIQMMTSSLASPSEAGGYAGKGDVISAKCRKKKG